jgi:anti-sigma factor RsiW
MTAADQLTCEDLDLLIHAYVFGRLADDDATRVRRHLQWCAMCRSTLEEIGRDTVALLEAMGLDHLPEDLVDLIIGAAAEAAETCRSRC